MKLLAATILTGLALVLGTHALAPVTRESCSCTADDGSCSTSVACPAGCVAFCPSRNCRSNCISGTFREDEGYSQRVSLRLDDSDGRAVAAELARITGEEVVFRSNRPDATFTLDVADVPLWDVLNTLSADASIRIGYEDFAHLRALRQSLLTSERMSVCFSNIPAARLAKELSFLTGLKVKAAPDGAKVVVNYSGTSVTFAEILTQVYDTSGVEFTVR